MHFSLNEKEKKNQYRKIFQCINQYGFLYSIFRWIFNILPKLCSFGDLYVILAYVHTYVQKEFPSSYRVSSLKFKNLQFQIYLSQSKLPSYVTSNSVYSQHRIDADTPYLQSQSLSFNFIVDLQNIIFRFAKQHDKIKIRQAISQNEVFLHANWAYMQVGCMSVSEFALIGMCLNHMRHTNLYHRLWVKTIGIIMITARHTNGCI